MKLNGPQEFIARIWVASYEYGVNPFVFYGMTMWSFDIKFPATQDMKKMSTIYKYLKKVLKTHSPYKRRKK